jgi:DNA-binding NtrC family response regulator
MATILVVDDELGIRALLSEILSEEGHSVEVAENAAQARSKREAMRPDLVLLDIWMPDVDGITLLKEWGALGLLTMPVVMMSGHGTIDTAVEATKFGASAFLEKPITLQKLLRAVEQALTKPTQRPASPPLSGMGAGAGGAMLAGFGGAQGAAQGYKPSGGAVSTAVYAGYRLGDQPNYDAPGSAFLGSPVHLAPGPTVQDAHGAQQSFDLDRPLREARDAFEKSYFEFHLFKEGGSMTRVAEKTGLERTHLYRKLKQLGVDLARSKRGGG